MDIKRFGFEYRIAEVMPMLDEMHLWGTMSLIRDLKSVVDEIEKIKNQTIDEFVANAEKWNNNIKSIRNEDGFFTIENIRDIARQMKAGAV